MTEYKYRTEDLAIEFGIAKKTVRRKASDLGIGINFSGTAGYRYSEADRQKLIESLRPVAPVTKRRRRRAA